MWERERRKRAAWLGVEIIRSGVHIASVLISDLFLIFLRLGLISVEFESCGRDLVLETREGDTDDTLLLF